MQLSRKPSAPVKPDNRWGLRKAPNVRNHPSSLGDLLAMKRGLSRKDIPLLEYGGEQWEEGFTEGGSRYQPIDEQTFSKMIEAIAQARANTRYGDDSTPLAEQRIFDEMHSGAIAPESKQWRDPMRLVEQLRNLESRYPFQEWNVEGLIEHLLTKVPES